MYETNEVNKEGVDNAPKKVVTKEEKPKKRFKWKKFLGYFILGIFVLGIGYIGYRFYTFTPYRVIVSNVTSRSATISWVTDSAEPGMVVFKEEKTLLPIWVSKYGLGNGFDDRDYTTAELLAAEKTQENIAESEGITAEDIETEIVVTGLGKYWSHHVTVRNLEPETEYEFLVGDGLVFERVNTVDTEVSKLTTLKEQESIDTPMPAYGIVRYYDGLNLLAPLDTIVYCTLEEEFTGIHSSPISSITSSTGGWYLDLTNAYTEDSERFLDAISTHEAVNISLNLVIENEWLGRWSKEIDYGDISPADEIVLYDINDEEFVNEDADLIYEGISFVEEDQSLSLVNKIYASKCSEQCKSNGVVDWTCVSKCIQEDNANSSTQLTVNQAKEAARWTARAASDIGKELTENTSLTEEEKVEYQEKMTGLKGQADSLLSGIDTAIKQNSDKIILGMVQDISYDTDLGQLMADRDDNDIRGECGANVCYPEVYGEALTCGNLDYTQCRCKCSNESDNISPGQVCACTEAGKIDTSQFKDQTDIPDPYSVEIGKTQGLCWNNKQKTTNTDKSCYSYTNQCWYSEGYVTNDGLLCYNREEIKDEMLGDWIQEGTEKEWEGYYTESLSEELGVCNLNHRHGVYEWVKSSEGTVTEQECISGSVGVNGVKGVCCNHRWDADSETCPDGMELYDEYNIYADDITTCEEKPEDGYRCVLTRTSVGQYHYAWLNSSISEEWGTRLIPSRKTPEECYKGTSTENMMCCSSSNDGWGDLFVWIDEDSCNDGGFVKHPEYGSIGSCSANNNSLITGTEVPGYTCYLKEEEDGSKKYVWDKFYYTDRNTLENLFGYSSIKGGCANEPAHSKYACESRNNHYEKWYVKCLVGDTRGYYLPNWKYYEDEDFLSGLVYDASITTEEECISAKKTDYKDIDPTIDFKNMYCEDSFYGYDLILPDSIVDTKYWNCGANHEWKEFDLQGSCRPIFSIGGTCCDANWVSYDSKTDEKMKCEYSTMTWKKVDDFNEKASRSIDKLTEGEKCDTEKYDWCLCYHGEFKDSPLFTPYKITDNTTICSGEVSASSQNILKLKNNIYAEDTSKTDKLIIDTENSRTLDLIPGEYIYRYQDETYIFGITEYEYTKTNGQFTLYLDINRNGEMDETDINLTDSATTIELEVLKKGFTYGLNQGFNFVSFPFVISEGDVKMASELLELLNYKYDNSFYSISKYDSGKWKMVGSNGGTYNQNDFQIIPGEGYVLKTKWDLNITLYGNEVTYESSTDSAPIRFTPGWNLVGLYGSNVKSYTAESILTDITNYQNTNFTAVNVSRWVENRALYEALQRDEDTTVYGLDFPIELKKGYFIKVTKGEGNWEPGID